jgi:hypothetical protein
MLEQATGSQHFSKAKSLRSWGMGLLAPINIPLLAQMLLLKVYPVLNKWNVEPEIPASIPHLAHLHFGHLHFGRLKPNVVSLLPKE